MLRKMNFELLLNNYYHGKHFTILQVNYEMVKFYFPY